MIDSRYPDLDIGVRVRSDNHADTGTVVRYDHGAGRPWVVEWDEEIFSITSGWYRGHIDTHLGDELLVVK